MLIEAFRTLIPHKVAESSKNVSGSAAETAYRSERLAKQLHLYDEVFDVANKVGVNDAMFVLGGVAYPWLREGRLHGDIDVLMQGKQKCEALSESLLSSGKFVESRERLLRGSSMKYLTYTVEPGCGPIEIRYVDAEIRNGVEVWTHELPGWVKLLLGDKPIVIPESAFSAFDDRLEVGTNEIRYVRPEYAYLIKHCSPYAKDKHDSAILETIIDTERAERIAQDIRQAEARLILPHPLMTVIRSFQCFGDGLSKDQYNHLLNG